MRKYQKPILIRILITLDQIKQIFQDYQFYENDIFSKKYRSKISIVICKDYLLLYPLESCNNDFIEDITNRLIEYVEI